MCVFQRNVFLRFTCAFLRGGIVTAIMLEMKSWDKAIGKSGDGVHGVCNHREFLKNGTTMKVRIPGTDTGLDV